MVDYNEFVSRYYPYANEQKLGDIKRFISVVNDTKKDTIDRFFKEPYVCSLFYIQKTNGVSAPHYKKIKGYLSSLFAFLGISAKIPTRETVLGARQVLCLFPCIDSMFDFIDEIGNKHLENYDTNKDLLNIKAIVALGWYGFSIMQVMQLPRRCLSTKNGEYFVESTDGTFTKIRERAYKYIDLYANSDFHRGLPTGRKVYYKSDDSMLIRGSSVGRADDNIVAFSLARFNKMIPSNARAILFRNLHSNALFVELYENKSEEELTTRIIRIMSCNSDRAYYYVQDYMKWVQLFHPKKI